MGLCGCLLAFGEGWRIGDCIRGACEVRVRYVSPTVYGRRTGCAIGFVLVKGGSVGEILPRVEGQTLEVMYWEYGR